MAQVNLIPSNDALQPDPQHLPQVAVFLGAGFSISAGVPLASQLFDSKPLVDRITRSKLVDRVVAGWERWSAQNQGSPEEYLAHLQSAGGREWLDAQWYVGLVVALAMGRVEYVGMKPTITRHNIDRTTQVATHEVFWDTIFRRTSRWPSSLQTMTSFRSVA